MFPTANSQVYRNEDGEVLGWDTISEPDPYGADDDFYARYDHDYEQFYPANCDHNTVDNLEEQPDGSFHGDCWGCDSRVRLVEEEGSSRMIGSVLSE